MRRVFHCNVDFSNCFVFCLFVITIQYKTKQYNTILYKHEYYYSGINPVEFRGHIFVIVFYCLVLSFSCIVLFLILLGRIVLYQTSKTQAPNRHHSRQGGRETPSSCLALPSQGAPPLDGGGLSHSLLLSLFTPCPPSSIHVTLGLLHGNHSPHTPSMAGGGGRGRGSGAV